MLSIISDGFVESETKDFIKKLTANEQDKITENVILVSCKIFFLFGKIL